MEYNLKEYFKDYVDDKLRDGVPFEELKEQVERIFENSHYTNVQAGDLFLLDEVVIDELKEEIIEEIRGMSQKKVYMR